MVCAAFASPRSAVDAAVAAQRAVELPMRMGIATGEAELRGADYFGAVLNRAARVMAAGHGGQILVADSTASLLAVFDAERDHNPQFKTFPDALWWSITTITTVGYGDKVPVTLTGRLFAVLLMIGAIGLVGSITATFASYIVQRVADEDTASQAVSEAATAAHIEELRAEIKHLADELRQQGLALGPSTSHRDQAEDDSRPVKANLP
jgi:voltage-gated potassium channel Kch